MFAAKMHKNEPGDEMSSKLAQIHSFAGNMSALVAGQLILLLWPKSRKNSLQYIHGNYFGGLVF